MCPFARRSSATSRFWWAFVTFAAVEPVDDVTSTSLFADVSRSTVIIDFRANVRDKHLASVGDPNITPQAWNDMFEEFAKNIRHEVRMLE